MKKGTALLTIVFLVLLAITFSSLAFAQVGVKQGDWFEYAQTLTQFDSETSGKIKIEILSVEGNYVVLRETYLDENNEEDSSHTVEGEVGKDYSLAGWIIPSNLGVGDSFHQDGSYLNDEFVVTISGTKELVCCGDARQVVYSSDSQMQGNVTTYWDVETGMAVEAIGQTDSSNYTAKLVDSNLWVNLSEDSDGNIVIYGVGAVVIIAIAVGIIFFRFKK